MPLNGFANRTHHQNATAAERPNAELLPLVLVAFLLMLQCRIAIGVYDPREPIATNTALAVAVAIDSLADRVNFPAPGIVTVWQTKQREPRAAN